jgi:hypothetical protein
MTLIDALIMAFATFYTAEVVTRQDGPFRVFARLRERFTTSLFSCAVCFAVWAAGGVWVVYQMRPELVVILAVAGAAVFVDRLTD